jgi:hypothetical protein
MGTIQMSRTFAPDYQSSPMSERDSDFFFNHGTLIDRELLTHASESARKAEC